MSSSPRTPHPAIAAGAPAAATAAAPRENVWDYPRPPALQPTSRRLRVFLNGTLVAETTRALRVLETSHPPTYYFPPADVAAAASADQKCHVVEVPGKSSFCEWKGVASYYDVEVPGTEPVRARVWAYKSPSPRFAPIAGYLSFYASPFECYVDDELVLPQPGDFYGGWMTSDIDQSMQGPDADAPVGLDVISVAGDGGGDGGLLSSSSTAAAAEAADQIEPGISTAQPSPDADLVAPEPVHAASRDSLLSTVTSSTWSSSVPSSGDPRDEDEDADGLVYALHTFVANLEGQVCVLKGDALALMDDTNSYWWLVRCVKTAEIGYIPAENIETQQERLARINKSRNIQITLTVFGDWRDDGGGGGNGDIGGNPILRRPRASATSGAARDISFAAVNQVLVFEQDDDDDDDDADADADGYSDSSGNGDSHAGGDSHDNGSPFGVIYRYEAPMHSGDTLPRPPLPPATSLLSAAPAANASSPATLVGYSGAPPPSPKAESSSLRWRAGRRGSASGQAGSGGFLSRLLGRHKSVERTPTARLMPPSPARKTGVSEPHEIPYTAPTGAPGGSDPSLAATTAPAARESVINVLRIYAGNVDLKATFKSVAVNGNMRFADLLEAAVKRFRIDGAVAGEYYLSVVHMDSQERTLPEEANVLETLDALQHKSLPGVSPMSRVSRAFSRSGKLSEVLTADDNIIRVLINRRLGAFEDDHHIIRVAVLHHNPAPSSSAAGSQPPPPLRAYRTIAIPNDMLVADVAALAAARFRQDGILPPTPATAETTPAPRQPPPPRLFAVRADDHAELRPDDRIAAVLDRAAAALPDETEFVLVVDVENEKDLPPTPPPAVGAVDLAPAAAVEAAAYAADNSSAVLATPPVAAAAAAADDDSTPSAALPPPPPPLAPRSLTAPPRSLSRSIAAVVPITTSARDGLTPGDSPRTNKSTSAPYDSTPSPRAAPAPPEPRTSSAAASAAATALWGAGGVGGGDGSPRSPLTAAASWALRQDDLAKTADELLDEYLRALQRAPPLDTARLAALESLLAAAAPALLRPDAAQDEAAATPTTPPFTAVGLDRRLRVGLGVLHRPSESPITPPLQPQTPTVLLPDPTVAPDAAAAAAAAAAAVHKPPVRSSSLGRPAATGPSRPRQSLLAALESMEKDLEAFGLVVTPPAHHPPWSSMPRSLRLGPATAAATAAASVAGPTVRPGGDGSPRAAGALVDDLNR
ncbi:hypothetical protein HK405_004959, partial [Cladochytrium tenue]